MNVSMPGEGKKTHVYLEEDKERSKSNFSSSKRIKSRVGMGEKKSTIILGKHKTGKHWLHNCYEIPLSVK